MDKDGKIVNIISGKILLSISLIAFILFNLYFFRVSSFDRASLEYAEQKKTASDNPQKPSVEKKPATPETIRVDSEKLTSQSAALDLPLLQGLNEGFEGFEKGELRSKDWQASQHNQAQAAFTIVEGENGNALQIDIEKSGNKNQWDIQLANEHVSVDEHQLLHFRAKIKGTRGAKAFFTAETQDYATLNGRQITFTGDWQNVAFELRPATEKIRVPLHFSFEQNTGARILVDDIQLLAAN